MFPDKIRYVIADDHSLFREGLRTVLRNYPDLELVGEAEDGEQLLSLVAAEAPHIVLLDLTMPVMNGLEAMTLLRRNHPGVHALILTMNDDPALVKHLINAGASGYLLKNTESAEIAKALRCCVETGFYLSNFVERLREKEQAQKKKPPLLFHKDIILTKSERAVLRLICEGKSAPQIAKDLSLSPRTIEGIRSSLKTKIGTQNVAGLVMYALKHGILF